MKAAHKRKEAGRAIVFARTTIVTPDATHDDFALAVVGDKIAAIGPSAAVLAQYPNAEIVDGRGKAILPGLINCHAHLTATLERGFNEDFGFPNAAHPALSPTRLLQGDEKTLMAQIGALEAIKSGTTSMVEFASGISSYAPALARSGLRFVFAESVADTANVAGADVGGRSGQEPDAAIFGPAPRRRHEADQRSLFRLARQGKGTHQRLSRRRAGRDHFA